jgi:hypothetical protein
MSSGFLQNAADATLTQHQASSGAGSYNNNFAKITLTTHTTKGGLSMPSGGVRWSHFELKLEDNGDNSQTDHACKVFFTWDSDGDDICAGPSESSAMVAGRTDVDVYMVAIDMDMVPVFPADGTVDTIYAWVSTIYFNDTTATLKRARLYWHELSKG